jgi:surfeit locus 1 family protein
MSVVRRLLVPGLSTLAMLVVLIGLGNWQVRRLAWKTALLDQIARAEVLPAVPLAPDPSPFAKVKLDGVLRGDLSALYASEVQDTRAGPQLGAQLVVPLQRPGEADVLVDLGWVPTGPGHPIPVISGHAVVQGFVHPAETPGWLSAKDDTAGRHFYTLDPQAIGAALGLARVAPFTLVAMGPPPPGGVPIPARHLPRPPNNHLSYAFTWYGLAVTLLVIFAIYVRKVLRR